MKLKRQETSTETVPGLVRASVRMPSRRRFRTTVSPSEAIGGPRVPWPAAGDPLRGAIVGTGDPAPIFAYMPIEVFLDRRLTLEPLRVLGVLFSFRSRTMNTIFPRRQAIAERCGMHLSNISTATSALERFGWLTKEGKGEFSKASRYTVTVPNTVAHSASSSVAESATRMRLADPGSAACWTKCQGALPECAHCRIRTVSKSLPAQRERNSVSRASKYALSCSPRSIQVTNAQYEQRFSQNGTWM